MSKRGKKRAARASAPALQVAQPKPSSSEAAPPLPLREASASAAALRPWPLWLALGLVALTFCIVLSGEFVEFDDFQHIRDNPAFQGGSPWAFVSFWTQPFFGLYVPTAYTLWTWVAAVSHALTSSLHPALFHAASLGVHVINVALVYQLLRLLLPQGEQQMWAAAFGAALFGLHPTQVESVAWASELRGLSAACLGLCALLIWLAAREHGEQPPVRAALLATLLFGLALLSKPSAVAIPLMLLVIERWRYGGSARWTLPFVWMALSAALIAVTRPLQPDVDLDYAPSLPERLLIAVDALGFYAQKLLLPFPLGMDYGRAPNVVLGQYSYLYTAALIAALAVLVSYFDRTRPWLRCAAVLMVVALLPVLGLVSFEFQFYSTVADRYLYLALFGLALGAAHAASELLALPARRQWVAIGAGSLLSVLAVVSHVQARSWRTTETLFQQALVVNPQSFAAYHGLARFEYAAGRFDRVAEYCRAAIAAKPDYLPAQKGLGDALLALGDRAGALRVYRDAAQQHAGASGKRAGVLGELHANFGVALAQSGDAAGGIEQLRNALALRPDLQSARRNLGRLLLRQGDTTHAIEQFRLALAANPRDELSRQELDRALGSPAATQ